MIKEKLTASPLDFDIIITSQSGEEYLLGSVKTVRKVTESQISYTIKINDLEVKKLIFENNNGSPGSLLITKITNL